MFQHLLRPTLLALVIGASATGMVSTQVAAQATPDAEAKIADAMSGGPDAISRDATILDWTKDDAGNFVVLRKGTNTWTCFPDLPMSPSDDPRCVDPTWMEWAAAPVNRQTPRITVPGIAYMLQGATDASNTDTSPRNRPGRRLGGFPAPHHDPAAGGIDQTVFTADYMSGGPSIMWPGTPAGIARCRSAPARMAMTMATPAP
ncbi:MAG: hypothetical protein R2853_09705 [Thermomicrobiales bacterium]